MPNPASPLFGIHFTHMVGGGVEAGPNAVFAFRRERRPGRRFLVIGKVQHISVGNIPPSAATDFLFIIGIIAQMALARSGHGIVAVKLLRL